MLTYVALITPYEIGFLGTDAKTVALNDAGSAMQLLFALNRIVDVFFLCDLIINFLTGVYDESKGWSNQCVPTSGDETT
jgi:hypothetical protein